MSPQVMGISSRFIGLEIVLRLHRDPTKPTLSSLCTVSKILRSCGYKIRLFSHRHSFLQMQDLMFGSETTGETSTRRHTLTSTRPTKSFGTLILRRWGSTMCLRVLITFLRKPKIPIPSTKLLHTSASLREQPNSSLALP